MRYFKHSILLLFAVLWNCFAFAQTNTSLKLSTIEITEDQTTHLIFPSNISYVDLGNSDYFITDYTDNILRIKGQQHQPTNLTIITQDQFYYSFLVQYSSQPQLNYFIETHQSLQNLQNLQHVGGNTRNTYSNSNDLQKVTPKINTVTNRTSNQISNQMPNQTYKVDDVEMVNEDLQEQNLHQTAQQLLDEKSLYHLLTDKHGDIKLKVTGVYHSLKHCFIKYEVQNNGAIPYDIAYTEFGVREKKRPKRTALHEEILPTIMVINGDQKRVLPFRVNRYVAVFEKLAVPKDRICYIEVIENGRNLQVSIPFNRIKIEAVRE